MLAEKVLDLGLDRLGEKGACPAAQDFCELIGDGSWLNQLDDVIFGHGISLLRWRSGGVKHPHDMPPFRFPPSPTFGDSSQLFRRMFRLEVLPSNLEATLGFVERASFPERRTGKRHYARPEPKAGGAFASVADAPDQLSILMDRVIIEANLSQGQRHCGLLLASTK